MSSLKVSLAQLGLVTLTAGALASPALADFSPLEQPLESDFFVSAGISDLSFGGTDKPGLVDQLKDNDKVLTIGANLFQDGPLVSGLVGSFTFGKADLGKTPFDAGAYLAYQDVAEDGTGLQLGALVTFESNVGVFTELFEDPAATVEASAVEASAAKAGTEEPEASEASDEEASDEEASDATPATEPAATTPAVDSYGSLNTKLFESYTLAIAEIGGNPVLLTQTATLTASKKIEEGSEFDFGLNGGLILSTKLDKLAPALSVEVDRASFGQEKTDLTIGGKLGFQATDSIALNVNAGAATAFGKDAEVKNFAFSYGAGLAFQASEGAELALDVKKAEKGVTAGLGLNLLF